MKNRMPNPDPDPMADSRFAEVVDRLQRPLVPEAPRGFAERVAAAARAEELKTGGVWWAVPRLAAAAAVLALAMGWLAWRGLAPESENGGRAAVAATPVEMLLAAQHPDGAWGPTAAPHRYDPAVTSLALLALVHHDGNPLASSHAEAFSAGMASLLRAQRPDGTFGVSPDASYLAFQALRAAHALPEAPEAWTEALLRAAPHVPSPVAVASLNRRLAHPERGASGDSWLMAGGPATVAAIELLHD